MSSSPKNSPVELIGSWYRFGAEGPAYQVIGDSAALIDGEHLMPIHVLESGEEVDYPLSEIMNDPQAD